MCCGEKSKRTLLLGIYLSLICAPCALAQRIDEREVTIPWALAGHNGLDALLVYAELPGKHPLAVITHGSSRKAEEHAEVTPWQELPQAIWFARRGWVALVVVRRGYGDPAASRIRSTPDDAHDRLRSGCGIWRRGFARRDRLRARAAASGCDARDRVGRSPEDWRRSRDGQRSCRTVAAINFAGGRGSKADHDVCNPGDLIHAYKDFGKHSRTPMLWLYAENDKFFWPELAQKFDAAFRSQGGRDQFVLAPAVGDDGHALFRHVEDWSATVDEFLKAQNSVTMAEPLPEITPPNVAPPAGLSEKGLEAFKSYLLLGPHKAFATSQHSFGFSTARRTVDEAREKALENCKHATQDGAACAVVSVDNADVRQ